MLPLHAKSIITHMLQVLKLSSSGKTRRIYVKRRDLLRANHLQPSDLRRIDPSLSITKTSPNISVKEHCLLVNLGGVRCTTACSICSLCLFSILPLNLGDSCLCLQEVAVPVSDLRMLYFAQCSVNDSM